MITSGSGANGLAVVSVIATPRDSRSGQPLHRLPFLFKALTTEQLDATLTCTLFDHGEQVTAEGIAERAAGFGALCKARDIGTVITVGGQALRAVSSVHGNMKSLIGSTIKEGTDYYLVPLDTHWSGFRALRAYSWLLAMTRFVRRGLELAKGKVQVRSFGTIVTGQGTDARQALERILDERLPVGADIETTGTDFMTSQITAMGLANRNVAVSVPWHRYNSRLYGPQSGLNCDAIRKLVEAILADTRITKIFHNGLFDMSVLGQKGVAVDGPVEDTYLAHKIAYPDLLHNLQFCMANEFAVRPWKTLFNMSRAQRREPANSWADTDPGPLMRYNAQDAAAELPLWERLSDRLTRMPTGWQCYRQLMSLGDLAADMQLKGVRIDAAACDALVADTSAVVRDVEASWESLGHGVPLHGPGSSKGLRRLVFVDLKAPVVSESLRTKEPQLNSAALLEYAAMPDNRPLAAVAWHLFRHRKAKKALDAFLRPLQGVHRVHAKPNPAGTRGTRFSYSEPNLQQWSKEKKIISPIDKKPYELAPNLRHLVCPDEGCVLGEHDYNALEVRLVAYAADISVWLQWLSDGVDMHSEHVRLMFGRTVTKKDPLRQITKTLTFARFYNRRRSVGQVLKSLKPAMPSLTESFLLEVFDRFDKARPEVAAWQQQVEDSVKRRGYVELPLSGQRQYHDRGWPDINAALSYGIQSTGGDIINAAALRIRDRLDAEAGERILINVHDALIWQARPERVEAVKAIFTEEMERPVDLWAHKAAVFPTECKTGPNWRDVN